MSDSIPMSQDAALVVALAGTAMPFSHSAEDQAERWLRALRLHGEVGSALQALGVSEAPLTTGKCADVLCPTPLPAGDVAGRVARRASELATVRGVGRVGTVDLLFAVFGEYGRPMERALLLRGTSRAELSERLGAAEALHSQ